MGLFYKATSKEQLELRNDIVVKIGISTLQNHGFRRSPFKGFGFGRYDNRLYNYKLCRLTSDSLLQMISIDIVRGDPWIRFSLNVFQLAPHIEILEQLDGLDGLKFLLPPNSLSSMRLRRDDYKGIPLFRILFEKEHKIGAYLTKKGLDIRIKELGELIKNDMANIDCFVMRWHKIHKTMQTTWEGNSSNDLSPEAL